MILSDPNQPVVKMIGLRATSLLVIISAAFFTCSLSSNANALPKARRQLSWSPVDDNIIPDIASTSDKFYDDISSLKAQKRVKKNMNNSNNNVSDISEQENASTRESSSVSQINSAVKNSTVSTSQEQDGEISDSMSKNTAEFKSASLQEVHSEMQSMKNTLNSTWDSKSSLQKEKQPVKKNAISTSQIKEDNWKSDDDMDKSNLGSKSATDQKMETEWQLMKNNSISSSQDQSVGWKSSVSTSNVTENKSASEKNGTLLIHNVDSMSESNSSSTDDMKSVNSEAVELISNVTQNNMSSKSDKSLVSDRSGTNNRQPRKGWSSIENMPELAKPDEGDSVNQEVKISASVESSQIAENHKGRSSEPRNSKLDKSASDILEGLAKETSQRSEDVAPMCVAPCSFPDVRSGRKYFSVIPKMICGYIYGYPVDKNTETQSGLHKPKSLMEDPFLLFPPEATASAFASGMSEGVSGNAELSRTLPSDAIPAALNAYSNILSQNLASLIHKIPSIPLPPSTATGISQGVATGIGLSHGVSTGLDLSGLNLGQPPFAHPGYSGMLSYQYPNLFPEFSPVHIPVPPALTQPTYIDFTFSSPHTVEHDTRVLKSPLSPSPGISIQGSSSYSIDGKHPPPPLHFPSLHLRLADNQD